MLNRIKIRISDLNIEIEYKNNAIAELCHDYEVKSDNIDISVFFDENACNAETVSHKFGFISAEFANIYRQIAEQLPFYSRAVCHGAVVSYNQNAYMFIAKSGTGKTTHINLWRKYFDGVDVINGDKPIIKAQNGTVFAYGTPWAGKENLQKNTSAPLKGICLIKRADKNSIRTLSNKEALTAILKQVYMPENEQSLNLTMRIIDDIIRYVPFYELSCNISREAAECSFNRMTAIE